MHGAWLSLGIALLVGALKFVAYFVSGSVALLSDAAESLVNILAAFALMYSLRVAKAPADFEHPYGHAKVEYLSSALEGALILLAALAIIVTSGVRLLSPEPLEAPLTSVVVALLATICNGGGALVLGRLATAHHSAALSANARHIWTDVWTSLGVVVGVLLVLITGWTILDPLLAMAVGANIVREGWGVMRGSVSNLLDARLPVDEERKILAVLDADPQVKGYHRLRSRRAGTARFTEVDIFVDPNMPVGEAHDLVTQLEHNLQQVLPGIISTVHVEPYLPGKRDKATPPEMEFKA